MPAALYLPRCLSRLAKPSRSRLSNLLLVGTVWLTTAIGQLSAEESVLRLVSPADRPQLQSTDEACTPVAIQPHGVETPIAESPTVESPTVDPSANAPINPFHRAANQWLATLGRPPIQLPPVHAGESSAMASAPQNMVSDALLSQYGNSSNSMVEPAAQVVTAAQQNDNDALRCYTSRPISELGTDISLPQTELPDDAAALCASEIPTVGDRRQHSGWAMTEHNWAATCMHHRPLYFEEENLERHGYTPSCTFQPIISGAKFFFTIPILPYKMALDPPRSCVYTLGYYRPGSCAPRRWHRLPLRVGAGVVEASVIVGLVFLIP